MIILGAYVTSLISKIDKIKNSENTIGNAVTYDDVRLDAEKILALLRQNICSDERVRVINGYTC